MTTAEDCLRKAEEWLSAAKAADDPKTSLSMRRVSDLWMLLGQRIEESVSSTTNFNTPTKLPADLTRTPRIRDADGVQAADVLRKRLSLGGEPL